MKLENRRGSRNACREAETGWERDDGGLYETAGVGKHMVWSRLDWGACEGEGGV